MLARRPGLGGLSWCLTRFDGREMPDGTRLSCLSGFPWPAGLNHASLNSTPVRNFRLVSRHRPPNRSP